MIFIIWVTINNHLTLEQGGMAQWQHFKMAEESKCDKSKWGEQASFPPLSCMQATLNPHGCSTLTIPMLPSCKDKDFTK